MAEPPSSVPQHSDSTPSLEEMQELVQAWVSSPEGNKKLSAVRQSTKSVVEEIQNKTRIKPDLLRQPVTL